MFSSYPLSLSVLSVFKTSKILSQILSKELFPKKLNHIEASRPEQASSMCLLCMHCLWLAVLADKTGRRLRTLILHVNPFQEVSHQ